MCRWQTYLGPPIFLEDLIYKPEHSLIEQSQHARKGVSAINADGVGIGWYGERPEPGRYRQTLPAWNDANLRSLAEHVKSRLFFTHIRASTGTGVSMSNCHPFAFNNWLFMHNGQIEGYAQIRRKMESLIPDNAYTHRHGTTDTEAFFLMMFAHNVESDPVGAFRNTIDSVEALQREAGIDANISMTAALSDGNKLIALRYASNNNTPPTLFWMDTDDSMIVVSEPYTETREEWTLLAPGQTIHSESGKSSVIGSLK